MTSKAKLIGAAMALGVVGAIGGAAVTFAGDIDQAVSSVDETAIDGTDASSFFVGFAVPRPVVVAPRPVVVAPRPAVVAPRVVVARTWVPGYWHGWRYHRGYWR